MKRLFKRLFVGAAAAGMIAGFILTISTVAQLINGSALPMTFGWGQATVLTGSMEPSIPTGSLILVQKQASYRAGDIVTYQEGDSIPVTHRIISISNGAVVTQGDANNTPDAPFPEKNIIGKVQIVLPVVGDLLLHLRDPLILTGLALVILLVFFIPIIKREEKKDYAR